MYIQHIHTNTLPSLSEVGSQFIKHRFHVVVEGYEKVIKVHLLGTEGYKFT
jgi:hypothetical protein